MAEIVVHSYLEIMFTVISLLLFVLCMRAHRKLGHTQSLSYLAVTSPRKRELVAFLL